jgi:hypothetical protein
MAFSTGIGDRGTLKSPREESSFASLASPLRSVGAQMPPATNDARGHLHRRFTTNNIPTLNTPLSPIGQQRRQAAEPAEFTTAVRAPSFLRNVCAYEICTVVAALSRTLGGLCALPVQN